MSFLVLIPAYRPTSALVELVNALRASTDAPILVIDDGSGPAFADVFAECLLVPGVEVGRNAVNLGKGAAVKHGLNRGLLAVPRVESFVTADADGQHRPQDVLAVAAAHDARSIVLGTRAFDAAVPLKSRIGNVVSRHLYRLIAGIALSDTQTGLRSIPRRLAEKSLPIRSNRYEFETEQLIVAQREGFDFKEVRIDTVYVDDNRGTHFHPILDSFRIYFVLLRYAAASLSTAAVDLAVFLMLTAAGTGLLTANLGARAIALVVQFYLLRSFVFRTDGGLVRFIAFVLYVAVMGFVSAAVQMQLSAHTGIGAVAAKILVESVLFMLNFVFLREFLFVRRPDA
jgi:putative flippase GtrA